MLLKKNFSGNIILVFLIFLPFQININLFAESEKNNLNNIDSKKKALSEIEKIIQIAKYNIDNGLYEKSESLILNAIELSDQFLDVKNKERINLIHILAEIYAYQGRFKASEKLYLDLLEINQKVYGTENYEYTKNILKLGQLYEKLGRYSEAENLFLKNKILIEKIYGKNHIFTTNAYIFLGEFYLNLDLYEKAKKLTSDACKISKNFSSQYSFINDEYYAICLTKLSNIHQAKGEYREAELLLEKSLKIDENLFGKENKQIGKKYIELADFYFSKNDFVKAETYALRSLKIFERNYINNIQVLRTLDLLADIYQWQNLNKKAENIISRALKLSKKIYGVEHPNYAYQLGRVGDLYAKLYKKSKIENNLFDEAKNHYENSLEIYIKKFGPNHKYVLSKKIDLAELYSLKAFKSDLYNQKDSHKLSQKAENILLEIYKTANLSFAENNYINTTVINALGNHYLTKSDYKKAENFFFSSLEINEKYKGENNLSTADALSQLALVYSLQGSYEKALPLFEKKLIIILNYLKKELPFLTLQERTKLMEDYNSMFNIIYSFSENSERGNRLLLLTKLNRQGLLEEIERNQARLANLPSVNKDLIKNLHLITKQISAINPKNETYKDLILKREKLEKKIYQILPNLKPNIIQIEEVVQNIPKGGILIEFQRYIPYDDSKSFSEAFKRVHYLALILNRKGEIKAIDIGPAKPIDKLIENGLVASENSLSDAQDKWDEISTLLLKPILKSISNSKIIIISPHRELNRLPFMALRYPESDKFLNEVYEIRLVTTGRELIEIEKTSKKGKKSLVVANPNFDSTKIIKFKEDSNLIDFNQKRSAEFKFKNWQLLPGTQKEGEFIAQITKGYLSQGDEATSLLIQKTNNPKILHVASHSYFFGDFIPEKNKSYVPRDKEEKFFMENPLVRSGIVLAGANNPTYSDKDDGYLTALEISKLNLEGTDLVVISGCESGLGEIRSGEGVYGLKRAISVAGAKSSLLSLWKVGDLSTAAFMESFYSRLKNGENRNKALANTQKEFRDHKIPGYRHPHVWAAFQLSGDWRPIDF